MGVYPSKKDDISIVLCGEAGQGIQTVEFLLTRLLKKCGYNFYATKEYMSRIRGGSNSTEIRVSSNRVSAFVERIDLLFPLTKEALNHVRNRISSETILIGESDKLTDENDIDKYDIIDIPFSQLAVDIGGKIYSNIIAVGVISALLSLEREIVDDYLKKYFSKKDRNIINNNIKAMEKGYEIGKGLINSGTITIEVQKNPDIK
ncbi:MAG TPA: 2-oxoacid:acceptor oxidoreductase subunit alpha, partial [bacterium]|nr:2-oxoacid:acceptor oxidoreductase subunit alpha [bacterium]